MIRYRIQRTIKGDHLGNYEHEYQIQYRRWWFPFWSYWKITESCHEEGFGTATRKYVPTFSTLNEAFKQMTELENLEKMRVKTKRVSYIYKEGDK